MNSNLIYGTASLGIKNYGSTWDESMSFRERVRLLYDVLELGISRLDTSPRYGDAELVIGELGLSKSNLLIDTKLDGIDITQSANKIREQVLRTFDCSLERMKLRIINTLYLHQDGLEFVQNEVLLATLLELKKEGRIAAIGSSVYSHKELYACDSTGVFDVIQIPYNALNQSFVKDEITTELIARSILVQGALLKNPSDNEFAAQKFREHFERFSSLCRKYQMDVVDLTKWLLNSQFKGPKIYSSLKVERVKSFLTPSEFVPSNSFLEELGYLLDSGYTFTNPRNW